MLGRPPNVPRRERKRAHIDLGDIQGNVLRGYTLPAAAYLFLRIVDVDAARALMTRMLPHVMTAEPWAQRPGAAMNVALTAAGLERLVTPEVLASFPEAFREGMAARADRLGDRGPSAPAHWVRGLGTGEAHALVTVYASSRPALRHAVTSVIGEDQGRRAVALVHLQQAMALPEGRDHFGFFDGIAQPAVEGAGVQARAGDGQPDGAGGWRELAAGEFLLGYPDEDGTLPRAPVAPFDRNGTFVAYRKLHMDTAAFRRFVRDAGYPGGPEALAAKIVGRWPDGTPLARSSRPDPAVPINDFGYRDDPLGLKCPVGAHVRRTNPRDAVGFFDGRLTNRHRIVRRGRPYGPPLPAGVTEDDGADRGLVFVCFQADLYRQFETIQGLWIDDGDPLGLGADKDFLVGEPHGSDGKMTIPGHPPFFLKPQPRLVTMRGGEYLFQPSMRALRELAAG